MDGLVVGWLRGEEHVCPSLTSSISFVGNQGQTASCFVWFVITRVKFMTRPSFDKIMQ